MRFFMIMFALHINLVNIIKIFTDNKILHMSQVQKLINVLQDNFHQKQQRYEAKADNQQDFLQELKAEISKHYRPPWKMSGIPQNKEKILSLKNKQLNSWQISRISLSKRSYTYPKNYRGIKIPSVGRQFTHFNTKDAFGHLPYLYQSGLSKIKAIKQKINSSHFARTNTVKHEYFGFKKLKPSKSQVTSNPILSSFN